MTVDVASFVFGSLLILIAVIGGGFQAKEISIPRVAAGARTVCALVGVVFVGIGLNGSVPETAPSELVTFKVHDQLGDGQVSEQVTLIVDGQSRGTLTVSAIHPAAEMVVTVPHEGRYSYQLSASAVFLDGTETKTYNGLGEGYIEVRSGRQYSLAGDISGDTWVAHLVEES